MQSMTGEGNPHSKKKSGSPSSVVHSDDTFSRVGEKENKAVVAKPYILALAFPMPIGKV